VYLVLELWHAAWRDGGRDGRKRPRQRAYRDAVILPGGVCCEISELDVSSPDIFDAGRRVNGVVEMSKETADRMQRELRCRGLWAGWRGRKIPTLRRFCDEFAR